MIKGNKVTRKLSEVLHFFVQHPNLVCTLLYQKIIMMCVNVQRLLKSFISPIIARIIGKDKVKDVYDQRAVE